MNEGLKVLPYFFLPNFVDFYIYVPWRQYKQAMSS